MWHSPELLLEIFLQTIVQIFCQSCWRIFDIKPRNWLDCWALGSIVRPAHFSTIQSGLHIVGSCRMYIVTAQCPLVDNTIWAPQCKVHIVRAAHLWWTIQSEHTAQHSAHLWTICQRGETRFEFSCSLALDSSTHQTAIKPRAQTWQETAKDRANEGKASHREIEE